MPIFRRIAPVAVSLLALVACAPANTGTVTATGAGPAPATTTQAADVSDMNVPFGGAYSGPTLGIALTKPVPYTPSDSALITQPTGRAVTMYITVTDNDATQAFSAIALHVQATSGSTQDQEIEDSANNVGSSTVNILPKTAQKWQLAFEVPKDAADITVQVSSLGGGKTIVFKGSL